MLFSRGNCPHIVSLVLLRKELFFMLALLVMTASIVIGYALPKKYESKTTIFIEQNVITDLVKGIAMTPSMQEKIKNLTVFLTSRNMITHVLKAMDKDLAFKNDSEQDVYIKDIEKRIQVSLNEKQGLLAISFLDQNPVFSRDFVNTMARVYIEENTSDKRAQSTEASKFLADQIEIYKKRLDAADAAINAYKSEQGLILSTDETFLRGQISEAEKKIEELTLKLAALTGRLEIFAPSKGVGGARPAAAGPEARLKQLLTIYTEKNPKVIRAREALAASRSGQAAFASAPEPVNRDGMTVAQSAKLIHLEMDSVRSMIDYQNKVLAQSEDVLRKMPQVKAELAERLTRRTRDADLYNQLVARYGQSEISRQMELKDKSTTFRVIDPAVAAEFPSSPNRPALILLGIALGLAAATLGVHLADRLDPTLRSVTDIKVLGLPILAVIPVLSTEAELLRKRRKDRLVTGLAAGYFALVLLVLTVESLKLTPLAQSLLRMTRHKL